MIKVYPYGTKMAVADVKEPALIMCTLCGSKVEPKSFRDSNGREEWRHSGKCQRCQDALFGRI
jgi:phage terminase large subunit GpA-like protein